MDRRSKMIKINDCDIIKDLLPSYAEGLTNKTTNAIIEEHLKDCSGCCEKLEKIRHAGASPLQDEQDRAEIKHLEKAGQRNRRRLLKLSVIMAVLLFFGAIAFHFLKEDMTGGASYRLSKNQIKSLELQLAQRETEEDLCCPEYLPDKYFVSLKIFGADRTGDAGFVYAYMYSSEYVKFKDIAIPMSGGNFSLKIKVSYTGDDKIHLEETFMPEDGELMEDSMKELFPSWAYLKYKTAVLYTSSGHSVLEKDNYRQVYDCWGVEVDDDYQLEVLSNGKYQLTKIDNDGSSGEFEYHVAEEGQLQKLNKDSK